MTGPLVVVERADAIAEVRIDRPDALNALSSRVLAELDAAFGTLAANPGVRAVVLTGTGERAFCAGADLHELDGLTAAEAHDLIRRGQRVMSAVESLGRPVIAMVNGLALGGGFELVLSCTFPVLSTRASLALPEAGLGLIPGYGGTQRLTRVVGSARAAYLMLSGERIDAERAHAMGLTPVAPVPPEELRARTFEIVETIASKGPTACLSILESLRLGRDPALELALAVEAGHAARAIVSTEAAEGVAAFREKRAPRFADGGGPA